MLLLRAMLDMNSLLRFFDRNYIVKFFLLLLFYSLFLLADGFILLYLAPLLGIYATLAIAASTGLIGLVVTVNMIHGKISIMRAKIKEGIYPQQEFDSIAGLILSGILLIVPGFFTNALGIILFLPFIRNFMGHRITKALDSRLKQAYEYMKIEEY